MRENLRVGIRFETMTGCEKPFLERIEIFNDAVVDDGDFFQLIKMRMAISIRRNSVRSPACVANAHFPDGGFFFQQRREAFGNFPSFFPQQ